MKTIFLFLILIVSLSACQKDSYEPASNTTDEVAVLKVDYQTTIFEGATELTFPAQASFTIASDYAPPGDFGYLKLYYQEANNAPLFDGNITWMGGTGEVANFPAFQGANAFPTTNPWSTTPVFEAIHYDPHGHPNAFPQPNLADLWNAIKDRQLVVDYLTNNPNAKIYYFLYTPTVGLGYPEDWHWTLFIKK